MQYISTKNLAGTLFFLFSFVYAVSAKSPARHKRDHRLYRSSRAEGLIGVNPESPVDNPSDNIFHVHIDEALKNNEKAYLVYDLDGVEDHTAVSRSINDQLAAGGYLVRKRKGWARQKERVDISWLKQGDNVIRFTIPGGANYSYRVKNVALEVEPEAGETVVINQPLTQNYYDNQAYVQGFIPGGKQKVRVRIGGKEARVWNGAFEALIDRPAAQVIAEESQKTSDNASWKTAVEIIYPDGTRKHRTVGFTHARQADYTYGLDNKVVSVRKIFSGNQAGNITLEGASLAIPAGALKKTAPISIIALRDMDIPAMDPGMVNVTRGVEGYRFLPHGTIFQKDATLALDYDASKIPEGYTVKDIRTYYFDEQTHHWTPLALDSVTGTGFEGDGTSEPEKVISRTPHFTDMINAVIKVPESPEVEAYNSNSMKGIKAADPSAAVNLIDPPKANSTGNASIGYPIEMPAGRGGLQPQVSISYNSGEGDGWLGMGWNLHVPAITLDTRWGVPRYDQQKETETYLFNGEQLSPVAHRGELVDRTGEKRFYPRVEGAFNRIIRHGNSTASYWWEVTDKGGTRYFYGGDPVNGADPAATLGDASGNIAHWALKETRDLHGNFIRYHYTRVNDAGVLNSTVVGTQLYISRITYTGYNGEEGRYSILFERDRDIDGKTSRRDISIMANNGFKEVTADLLKRIDVQYLGTTIRHYELTYKEGAFYKTLLTSISQFDAQGNFFNKHEFDYYNDIAPGGILQPFAAPKDWTPGSDGVHGSMITHVDGFTDEASALSGTASKDFSAGVTVMVGLGADVTSKLNSVGGSFGYTRSDSRGLLSMMDINGDGLPDKLFMDGNQLYYRPNLSGASASPGTGIFGDRIAIDGINVFEKDKTKTTTFGVEADALGGLMAGANTSRSTTTTTIYFTDANGDQLPDIVKDGVVYFNHIDTVTGKISFIPTSEGTPSRVFAGIKISGNIVNKDSLEAERQQAIDNNPLHDIVRVWRAPYSGVITVTAPVQLLPSNDPERVSAPADGVRAAIQLRDAELWSEKIGPDDYSVHTPTGVSNLTVQKDDRIYFRIGSIDNGSYDSVQWAPVIEYANQDLTQADANRKALYRFEAGKDFVLSSAVQTVSAPINGQVRIDGLIVKPITTDDVQFVILQSDANSTDTVWQAFYRWDTAFSTNLSLNNIPVQQGKQYSFKVLSSTNIDWSSLQWNPHMIYLSASDPQINLPASPVEIYPVPDYSLFSYAVAISKPFKVDLGGDQAGTLQVSPLVAFSGPGSAFTGQMTFSVKKRDTLLGKTLLNIVNGSIASGGNGLTVSVRNGDSLFIEYHAKDPALAAGMTQYDAGITGIGGTSGKVNTSFTAGVYSGLPKNGKEEDIIFGPLYRGWGHFAWNGNRDRATQPIDQSQLKPSDQIQQKQNVDPNALSQKSGDQLDPSQTYNPKQDQFIILLANGRRQRWEGYDPEVFLNGTNMSSSRMGDKDVSIQAISTGDSAITSGTGAAGIDKISKVTSYSFTIGASAAGAGVSASTSTASSRVLTDFVDMNGDRYPDVVTENIIQYTNARGGLSDRIISNGQVQLTNSTTKSISLSGSNSIPTAIFRRSGRNSQRVQVDAGNAQTTSGSASFSGSLSAAEGTNNAKYSLIDMNGDGLPDRVNQDNQKVSLNLGYGFAPEEDWGFDQVQAGSSTTVSGGAGLGFSRDNKSFSIGFSLARSDNHSSKALQDVNGDGLPDLVIYTPSQPLQVRLNTGNGFSQDVLNWTGAGQFSSNNSATESANLAFTIGFTLFGTVKFTVTPDVSASNGMSRDLVKLTDLNGDGYPDYVLSSKDDQLNVATSTIGRTNKLELVKRPMGALFLLDYQRVGNTYNMPENVWVLGSVKVFDGVKGDGADTLMTTFLYEGGYFDRNEREFYGFKKVTTQTRNTLQNNAVYATVSQTFGNDNYYTKGVVLSEAMQSGDGKKFTGKENVFALKDINTGTDLPDSYKQSDAGAAFVALMQKDQRFYEGQPQAGKATRFTYGYDTRGNVTNYTDFGDEGPGDDISAAIAYHDVEDKYIVSAPKSILVTGSGKTFRRRESDIDEQTGDVKQIRQYNDDGKAAITDMEYDVYGNLQKITKPANAAGQRMSNTYTYDDSVHTYTNNVVNSHGYRSAASYDILFGKPLVTTDMNGNQIVYSLDALGRTVKVTGPYEKVNGVGYTIKFEYHPEDTIPWALTSHFDPANPKNDLQTVTFTDGLERVLQVKKDIALYQGDGKADKEQMSVSGRVLFDGLGRVVSAYYPVTENTGAQGVFNRNFDPVAPTVTTYDVMNRLLTVTLPDGSATTHIYSFGNDRQNKMQFSTRTTDANGKITELFTNVRGRMTAEKNYTSGDPVWTSFVYDPINEQVEAADDMGNTTYFSYDMLGRTISRKHPDAGLTTYKYDLSGNLIQRVTANLQKDSSAISYTYDFEHLTGITYPQNPENNVHYTYGVPGAPYNRTGRIVLQQDATGAQEFFYGPFGETLKNTRTVVIPGHDEQTFVTEWTYDTWNRLTSMIYPDGEQLSYTYNNGGLLTTMSGRKGNDNYNYVRQLGYDKFEQRLFLAYGNGTKTTYGYETDRRRLKTMTARTAAGRPMMDNVYGYDRIDHVLDITNNAPVPANNLMGGPSTSSYEYDDLYRLVKAGGTFARSNEEQRYGMSVTYNGAGSITRKTQQHDRRTGGDWKPEKKTTYDYAYTYNDVQPHAPVHIGQQAYTYDANGNQTGWTSDISGQRRKMLWDEENRLRTVYDNGSAHHYIYDAEGIRVLKGQSNGQAIFINGVDKGGSGGMGNFTVYVNPYIVLRSGGYTKHFYIEHERIVSKLGSGFDNKGKGPLKAGGDSLDYKAMQNRIFDGIVRNLKFLGADGQVLTAGKSGKVPPGQIKGGGNGKVTETFQYYYHPDHTGSTSYVSDASGEVFQHVEYFAFGETFVDEHSNTDRVPYLFNGKELDEETGLYYFGTRYYDPRTSVWQSVDPEASRTPGISPYAPMNNDPVNYIDPDGSFSVNNHYDYTHTALRNLGYSKKASDLVAHYASVYADHPPTKVMIAEMTSYRKGIDYSKTANSQDTKSAENSTWHSMKADGENISNAAAMARGQAFGWGKIIQAGAEIQKAGGIEKLKENDPGLQDLGQGIHALQDAIAHKGTDMAHHSVYNDMYPSKADATKAENAANTGVIVAEVLGGNYTHVKDGMTIDLTGTTKEQYSTIKSAFDKAVGAPGSGKPTKVYFTGKPAD